MRFPPQSFPRSGGCCRWSHALSSWEMSSSSGISRDQSHCGMSSSSVSAWQIGSIHFLRRSCPHGKGRGRFQRFTIHQTVQSFIDYSQIIRNVRMVQVNPLMVMDDKVVAYPVYLARGNTQTCAAQGFIATLSLLTSVSYYTTMIILCEFINCAT